MKKNRKGLPAGRQGFTLVEILVVTAIIVIISGVLVINFRKGGESGQLQRSAQKIAQDIRKVQSMALSSVKFGSSIPAEGYGVRFRTQDLTSYLLFADTQSDGSCGYPGSGNISSPSLEKDIEIDSLYTYTTALGTGMVSRTVITSCFIPPDPKTSISPAGAGVGGIIVNIRKKGANCTSSPSSCRNVALSKLTGMVSIGFGAIK